MKRVQFSAYFTQYFFIAPQLVIILIFLYLPIVQTFRDAFTIQDAFGFGRYFSGFDNFVFVLSDPNYIIALKFTLIFIAVITFFSCSIGLLLAVQANNVIHGKSAYKTLLIWPYAIAPAVVGVTANYFFSEKSARPLRANTFYAKKIVGLFLGTIFPDPVPLGTHFSGPCTLKHSFFRTLYP